MNSVSIEYRIKLSENKTEAFKFELDGKTFDLITNEIPDPPQWTELSFKQCSHCPLSAEEHSHCPMALQLYDIVERFHNTRSIDNVELEVITKERRVIQTLAIQTAIASILDLVLPICGCPITAHMKPLARFHLPLASEEETVFRVTGMYLLAQYFLSLTSKRAGVEFDGLTKIYEDLHILDTAIASRLQGVTQSDSLKNAITLVDMYSILVPLLLEDQLAEMRGFFEAYLPEVESGPATTNHLDKAKAFRLELVPLDEELKDVDDRPDWLKEVGGEKEPEVTATTETPEPADEKESTIDKILNKSGLKLELEPLEDEKESPSQLSIEGENPGKPKSTKAVFKLPDD